MLPLKGVKGVKIMDLNPIKTESKKYWLIPGHKAHIRDLKQLNLK